MKGPDQFPDLDSRATAYAGFTTDELLIELDRLVQPTSYFHTPDNQEKKREGESLWRSYRPKLAALVCKDRERGGSPAVAALVIGGASAFIKEVAKTILGTGVLPGIEEGVAAATAGLLYKELQKGIDAFCEAHYSPDEIA